MMPGGSDETDLLTLARARHGDQVALFDGQASWSFECLGRAVDFLRQAHPLHVDDGNPLWVLDAPPSASWFVFLMAAWRAGHRVLPLGRRLAIEERAELLNRLQPDVVVNGPELEDWSSRLEIATRREQTPTGFRSGAETWVLTSGSSGPSKVARLTWSSQVAHARLSVRTLALGPGDTWWADLPLHHVGGLGILVRSLASGCRIWLRDRVDPGALDQAIQEGTVTRASVVPTSYRDWLTCRQERTVPPTFRTMLVGGAGTAGRDLARFDRAIPTYGLTEAGSHVTLGRPGMHASQGWGDGGWALSDVQIRLGSLERDPLPGDEGQVYVKSPGLFSGYVGDPTASGTALVDGWLATGDRGAWGEDGRLWIQARLTDLIVSGGENLSPSEIELAVSRILPDRSCIVVGVPDARWGHRPVVVFEGSPLAGWDLERLRGALQLFLSRHKHPRALLWQEAFPRLPGGKIDRRSIASWAREQNTE